MADNNGVPYEESELYKIRHSAAHVMAEAIQRLFPGFVEVHGDRRFADDHAIMAGFADFHDEPVLVVGHVKGRDTKEKIFRNFGYARPEGYRKALRAMRLAEKFGRPVIVFVDTPGVHKPGHRMNVRMVDIALDAMRALERFSPYLTGPVLKGTAGPYAGIDLQLFPESPKDVELYLLERHIPYETHEGRRYSGDRAHAVSVLCLEWQGAPLKLSVFDPRDERWTPIPTVFRHRCRRPARQFRQWPQVT